MEREHLLALIVSQLHYYNMPTMADALLETAHERGLALDSLEPSPSLAQMAQMGQSMLKETAGIFIIHSYQEPDQINQDQELHALDLQEELQRTLFL